MEYPHWMMVAGAWLVVAGFIGLGFSRYMNRAPAKDNLHPAATPPNSSVAGTAEGEEMSARPTDPERTPVLCSVRAGGHLRADPRQDRSIKAERALGRR